jgi:PIN domain nuclease of toxin-antitoxin system
VNFLLDTRVLLWWLDDAPDLSDEARELIKNKEDLVFVSAATIWEIRIKQGLGKVAVPDSFMSVLAKQAFEFLPITIHHADAITDIVNGLTHTPYFWTLFRLASRQLQPAAACPRGF